LALAEALREQRLRLSRQMPLPCLHVPEKLTQFRVVGLVGILEVLLTGVCPL